MEEASSLLKERLLKNVDDISESDEILECSINLKQPCPRDVVRQCFVKRDKQSSTYLLYEESDTKSLTGERKFLLAAYKVRWSASHDYIISVDAGDFSKTSNKFMGELRSNILGTKFTIYDSQPHHSDGIASTSHVRQRVHSNQVSPGARRPAGDYPVGYIEYELNLLGMRGPRRMKCQMNAIPASDMDIGGPMNSSMSKERPLLLKSKPPKWHEQLQCWCLNFKGRVKTASVKNFQLLVASETSEPVTSQSDYDKILLQFGKVEEDMFTMDYRYPLSAFQVFAICLSSFGHKLACE